MQLNKMIASATAGFLLVGTPLLAAENPKQGNATYFGAGHVEHKPEFGETHFNVSVKCMKSVADVRKAIESVSGPIWKDIMTQVPTFNETERKYWGDITNIQTSADSYVVATKAGIDSQGKPVAGTVRRISTCENKELPLETPVGQVFSGSQRLGVRTSNFGWLMGAVKTANRKKQGKLPTDVQLSADTVSFDVTQATRSAMVLEVKRQARERATGAGSVFESDKKSLQLESAHLLGDRVAYPDFHQQGTIGSPVEKGKAPKVTVELPFVYTVYAEVTDRVDPTNSRGSVGNISQYEALGTSISEADYARLTVTISASCLPDKDGSPKVIEGLTSDVKKDFENLQGRKQASETDRLIIGSEPSPTEFYAYTPIKWKVGPSNKEEIAEYYDNCAGKTVPAPAKNQDLPKYWQITRQLSAHSSDFAGILKAAEDMQLKYGVSSTDTSAVKVEVAQPVGRATKASLAKLLVKARENATACVLDPKGSLADNAGAQGFKCAHIKSIRIGEADPRPQAESVRGGRGNAFDAAPMQKRAAPGGTPDEFEIVEEKVDPDALPTVVEDQSYAFDFQFVSKDYVPLLKAPASTPMP